MTSLYYKNRGLLPELNIAYSDNKSYEDLAPSDQNKLYLYTPEGALAWYTLNLRLKYQFCTVFTVDFGSRITWINTTGSGVGGSLRRGGL
jgi:hemoglobin/transferrin/lactoferrin receptor protein